MARHVDAQATQTPSNTYLSYREREFGHQEGINSVAILGARVHHQNMACRLGRNVLQKQHPVSQWLTSFALRR